MLEFLKRLIPSFIINLYHGLGGLFFSFYYGRPSEKMTVIGVTGTKGKSTTCHMIAHILENSGRIVGMISTPLIKIGPLEKLNNSKMTMLGALKSQKLLRLMADSGCGYVVIESSSQGLEQNRHWGIKYDVAVLTNLFPEHIEAHKGFENYKKAKLKLYDSIRKGISVINLDADDIEEFLNKKIKKIVCFTSENKKLPENSKGRVLKAQKMDLPSASWRSGVEWRIENEQFSLKIPGEFNFHNALAAITASYALGIDLKTSAQALEKFNGTPGRMEIIDEGQPFRVIVDYAHEPHGLKAVYESLMNDKKGKLISVLGSAGGGRDKWRRPEMGKLAAQYADIVIITNEDPYDENPQKIIDEVAYGVEKNGNLFKILDRKEAIKKALKLAQVGDTVLLTGKGAEQWIMGPKGSKIPWDEREVARKLLKSDTIL